MNTNAVVKKIIMFSALFATILFVPITSYSSIINISPDKHSFQLEYSLSKYSFALFVEIFVISSSISNEYIQQHLQFAQSFLDKNNCGIKLSVHSFNRVVSTLPLFEWESFEFNDYVLSFSEKAFFGGVPLEFPALLFVDELEWSYGPEGTSGIGYSSFITDYLRFEEEKEFYLKHMIGTTVLSPFMNKWTLIHEIGHSVFNLKHTEDDISNIMFPFKNRINPSFSAKQCEQAKSSAFLQKLQYLN